LPFDVTHAITDALLNQGEVLAQEGAVHPYSMRAAAPGCIAPWSPPGHLLISRVA
jgi:hypothetical protein